MNSIVIGTDVAIRESAKHAVLGGIMFGIGYGIAKLSHINPVMFGGVIAASTVASSALNSLVDAIGKSNGWKPSNVEFLKATSDLLVSGVTLAAFASLHLLSPAGLVIYGALSVISFSLAAHAAANIARGESADLAFF